LETIQIGNVNQQIKLPNTCPLCHRHIVPKKITEKNVPRSIIQVVYQCSSDRCSELFIAYYHYKFFGRTAEINLRETKPKNIEFIPFPDGISNISPTFVGIFNQANTAEKYGLDQICGPGYRKSLEFLIKDYLISTNEHPEDDIKGKFLGDCIKLIQDGRIRFCAERATWLGNDETHYVRKWEEKDITNLKELIDLTVHWISMELITQKYKAEMPGKG
jgi:hypothetical protein